MKTRPDPRPLDRLAIRATAWAREKIAARRVKRALRAAAKPQKAA
jgi:hypothetical protein